MIVVPLLYLTLRLSMGGMFSRADRAKRLESAVVARVYESLSAIRLVKMFAREAHEVHRFSGVARAAMDERLAVIHEESFFSFLVAAITAGGATLVLGIGGLHVLRGTLTVGTLLVDRDVSRIRVRPAVRDRDHGRIAARRAGERAARYAKSFGCHGRPPARRPRPSNAFAETSVSRTSPSGMGRHVPCSRSLNFVAQAGETVALVGLSGAGKTTIVSLIGRSVRVLQRPHPD